MKSFDIDCAVYNKVYVIACDKPSDLFEYCKAQLQEIEQDLISEIRAHMEPIIAATKLAAMIEILGIKMPIAWVEKQADIMAKEARRQD